MLTGVHFILTYMCNFECDHCFLYCSPSSKGTFTLGQVKDVLEELQKIGTVETVCFEGGEPFLFYPILIECTRLANDRGFKTAIETNAYWATTKEDADVWLLPLMEAGLTTLEVSDDAFHHGEDIDNPAKRAFAAAKDMDMGVDSICIDEPVIEEEEKRHVRGWPIYAGGPKLRGRAVDKLTEGLPRRPWKHFHECPLEDLRNPQRVHVDSFGNVHLCQGLSMGNMWETPLRHLVESYDPDAHPISGPLLRGGPARLAEEYNVGHESEYVDACHMCSKICLKLIDRFPQYIGPRQVYGLE
jgi:organic radical activating enzyme